MARALKTWIGIAVVAVMAAGAGLLAFGYTHSQASPAPLGVPLPVVHTVYELLPDDQANDTSVLQRRIPEPFLEMLTLQPDGATPLRYDIHCEMADFHIQLPYGAQTRAYAYEDVIKDGTLIEAPFLYGQPLKAVKLSAMIRREGETVQDYAQRLRDSLTEQGAEFKGDSAPLDVDGYVFEHFEYCKLTDKGELVSHYVYIGSLGPLRVLVVNFMATPDLYEASRSMVVKIMNSFIPGWTLQELAEADKSGMTIEEAAALVAGD